MGTRRFHFFCIGIVLEKERSGNYCHFHGEQTWTTLKRTKWICAVCCFWPPKTSASIFNSGSATGNCAVFLSAGSDGRWSTQAVGMVWHIGVSRWLSGCEAPSIFLRPRTSFWSLNSLFSPVEALETGLPSGFSSSYFRFGSHFSFYGGLHHQISGKSHILGCWDQHQSWKLTSGPGRPGPQAPVWACDNCLGQARRRLLNGLRMPLGCHGCNSESCWNPAQNLKPGWFNSFVLTNQPGFTHFIQHFLFKIVDCHKLTCRTPGCHNCHSKCPSRMDSNWPSDFRRRWCPRVWVATRGECCIYGQDLRLGRGALTLDEWNHHCSKLPSGNLT